MVKSTIIINACNSSQETTRLCIDSLIANTDLRAIKIYVYSYGKSFSYQFANVDYGNERSFMFLTIEPGYWSAIFSDMAKSNKLDGDIVLLNSNAIVAPDWLSALQTAVRRQDIGASISRQIMKNHKKNVLNISPYAKNDHDVDVAISAVSDILLDPGFDEISSLCKIRHISQFCTLFKSRILSKIDFGETTHLSDQDWILFVSNQITKMLNLCIVYTPDSKVFNANYFYT